jgi:hypothetical protein
VELISPLTVLGELPFILDNMEDGKAEEAEGDCKDEVCERGALITLFLASGCGRARTLCVGRHTAEAFCAPESALAGSLKAANNLE